MGTKNNFWQIIFRLVINFSYLYLQQTTYLRPLTILWANYKISIMENIEILSMRIRETVEKLRKLVDENNKLRLEVVYLKKESERGRKDVSEYMVLRRNIEEAAAKIEKIIKKIDMAKVS